MPSKDDYRREVEGFGEELAHRFGGKYEAVAYAGGVPGWMMRLPDDEFGAVYDWMERLFGPPQEMEKWHPSQRRNTPVYRFRKTKEMEHMKMDHVNLIRMGTRKDLHTLVTWM